MATRFCEYGTPAVPAGSERVVMETAAATAMLSALVALAAAASVTLNVKFDVRAAVGMPSIAPLRLRLRPGGSEPEETAQEYGVCPPVAASVDAYAAPTSPPGSEDVVIVGPVCAWAVCATNRAAHDAIL